MKCSYTLLATLSVILLEAVASRHFTESVQGSSLRDLPAAAKESRIMSFIENTKGTRGKYPGFFGKLNFLLRDDVNPTMTHDEDTLPYSNHGKRIHSVGFVASIEFNSVGGHPYTGLFTGAPFGLIRMSLAEPASKEGTSPGVAIKFFRDGMSSVNFFAMYRLQGQSSGNFFENDFTNHVPLPPADDFKLNQLVAKFDKASAPSNQVGLSDIAKATADGAEVEDIEFPYEVILKPASGLREKCSDMATRPTADLKETFNRIPSGTDLYDVFAKASPVAEPTLIGTLKTKSALMDSKYGDNNLFFRHQKISEDLELHPECKPAACLQASKCPFG